MDIAQFPKITIILRGWGYAQAKAVVSAMMQTSFRSVEITLNTPGAIDTISKLNKEFGEKVMIGAGTVLTLEQAKAAADAGAKFLLSPIVLSKEILDFCKASQMLSIPGAFTPSEMVQCLRNGADIVKLFPASALPKQYLKDIMAPLGKMPIMAVGGVNSTNVSEFFRFGASYVGVGAGMFRQEDIVNGDEKNLLQSIQEFEAQVKEGKM